MDGLKGNVAVFLLRVSVDLVLQHLQVFADNPAQKLGFGCGCVVSFEKLTFVRV